ncbi:MAG: sterol desaturase family protein [Chitinophagales bacterium]|nr:sterol desaturase family protein [Chitinophagaceae bacterium]MCB9065837.1 sterol desaturase family protein [Chitinophagales bacterium]
MNKYWDIIVNSFTGYWNYLVQEVTTPSWTNYFYWLVGLSLLVWVLEISFPWRKKQSFIRKDFWLDGFYVFFNFFLFSLIGYNALSNVAVEAFNDFLGLFGITNLVAIHVGGWPVWAQFLLMFILADFIQWNVHRMLHRVPWMWKFHKLHHSVKEMGFAAHMRFHFMETIFYKTAQYLPLAMIGFGIQQFFIIHMFTVLIGHLNHANVGWGYGPIGYIFNNPKMHIWHHAKHLPKGKRYGVNFGISLSLWDYLFRTAYIPQSGRDIELGFDGDEGYPEDFAHQVVQPFNEKE